MIQAGLFAGIGGFELAAKWKGWQTAFWCEIDPYCQSLLKQNFNTSIGYGDIRNTDFAIHKGKINILTGGFPCQDISLSGYGKGIYGERSGLWGEFARAIKEISPPYVVIENSPALLTRGFEKVLCDLAAIGYDAEWQCISAADIGFDHIRNRLWVVAYPVTQRWRGILHMLKRGIIETSKEANTLDTQGNPFLRFAERYGEPAVFGMADGLPKRVDVVKRLAGCGNAVVPQIPHMIYQMIEAIESIK